MNGNRQVPRRIGKLKEPVTCQAWGTEITLPAGTAVHWVADNRAWVVTSTRLLMNLTGNIHDPVYRYLDVPADKVAEDAIDSSA